MSRRLFDHDPDSGTTVWFDPTDEGFNLTTEQDVAPILDRNKALAGGSGKEHWKGDFRLEASIPNSILLKWAVEDGVPPDMVFSDEYASRIVRRLNDPDYRHFKTANVRV
jgi:hypothetical protein